MVDTNTFHFFDSQETPTVLNDTINSLMHQKEFPFFCFSFFLSMIFNLHTPNTPFDTIFIWNDTRFHGRRRQLTNTIGWDRFSFWMRFVKRSIELNSLDPIETVTFFLFTFEVNRCSQLKSIAVYTRMYSLWHMMQWIFVHSYCVRLIWFEYVQAKLCIVWTHSLWQMGGWWCAWHRMVRLQ